MQPIHFTPIGRILSPFKKPENMPIQPSAAQGVSGSVELLPEYTEGLQDLDGFSHIYLLYYFHLSQDYNLKIIPFLDTTYRGLFATRAPKRPNPIGLSIVKLVEVKENIIEIANVDIVDQTPLLDIKPYVPQMDAQKDCKIGWLTHHIPEIKQKQSDKRFSE
jgi:tRNA-Thr(GGU) m(6)t(6)A37 methyltransferase TsaA